MPRFICVNNNDQKEKAMGNDDNEQGIDLKEMLFNALRHWRSILVAGLAGALLLGAWKGYGLVQKQKDLERAIANGTVTEADYDSGYLTVKSNIEKKEKEILEQKKQETDLQKQINDFRNVIEKSEASIASQKASVAMYEEQLSYLRPMYEDSRNYLEQSVSMQAAEECPTVTAAYFVTLPEGGESYFRDPADQIVSAYYKPSAVSPEIKALSKKYGLSATLMGELYSVVPNTTTNLVYVVALGKDRAMAEEICSVVGKLLEQEDKLIPIDHAFTFMGKEFRQEKNEELTAKKKQKLQEANEYMESIHRIEAAVDTAGTTIRSAERDIANAQIQIDYLTEEKEAREEYIFSLSDEMDRLKKNMPGKFSTGIPGKSSVIKYAVIGFITGAMLLFILYILVYVMKPVLRVADDIPTVYGYPILGALNKKVREKLCIIDKWIMKAEGCGKRPEDGEVIKAAAITINHAEESGSFVAIMTTLKENQTLEKITDQLREHLPDMRLELLTEGVSRAANVDELSRCDAVLLLEERNATSMRKLTADVSQIRLLNKKVLGAIVM